MPRAARVLTLLAVAATLACAAPAALAFSKVVTLPPSGDNQFCSVTQGIGLVRVTVEYSSPNVHAPDGRDRKGHIWGELVPYGLADLGYNDCKECPWRGGANENTVFTISHPVKIEGQALPAGSYGLHFIPGKDAWTVIFSKDYKAWGSFWYDPAKDQLRVTVKPEACEYHEWLTYEFTDRETDHATVALKWENLAVPIRITVDDIAGLYVENLKDEFRNAQAFYWKNFVDAADFCLQSKSHLDQGLFWAQEAVTHPGTGVENFETLTTLAQLQLANGRKEEGAKTFDRATALPGTTPIEIHGAARSLQMAGDNEGAKRLFQLNAKRFPNQWPVNVGLARANAIDGKYKEAADLARKAMAQAPDEGNRKNLEMLAKQWDEAAKQKK
jgi:tetratricopeptide (TPR) repeat protein